MKAAFFHDAPLLFTNNDMVYSIGFPYAIWERYLHFFNELTVSTRMINENNLDVYTKKGFKISSGPGIEFRPIKSYKKSTDFMFNRNKIKKDIRSVLKNVDCAVIRLPSIIGMIAYKEAVKLGMPYVLEVVGCPWDSYRYHSVAGKVIALNMHINQKRAVKKSPYVIYVTKKFLQKRYPNNNCNVGCSDVSLKEINKDVVNRRESKIINLNAKKKIIIGTTASVDVKLKSQDLVIKAISILNKRGYNFEYQLVGGGSKVYLESIAKKYGVIDKVIFKGSLTHEQVFDWLESIDVYIQPSKTEGLSRALVEAMSVGCPCIGSNVGGIPELLDNPNTFTKGNVKELIDLLGNLNNSKMIEQSKRNFSISLMFKEEVLNVNRKAFFEKFTDSIN